MMKTLLMATALAALCAWSGVQAEEAEPAASVFDAELAERLGADQYGMRPYVLALLKSGATPSVDAGTAAELQRAHLANIRAMAERGDLVLAGPFMSGGELRGLYLFKTDSVEQAEAWTASDPAIQAGALVMELIPWYGSAALLEVPAIHQSISRESP
jgi:uncharacterized protein YciI